MPKKFPKHVEERLSDIHFCLDELLIANKLMEDEEDKVYGFKIRRIIRERLKIVLECSPPFIYSLYPELLNPDHGSRILFDHPLYWLRRVEYTIRDYGKTIY